jgi:hypothetical protein
MKGEVTHHWWPHTVNPQPRKINGQIRSGASSLDGVGSDQGAGQDQAASMILAPTGIRVWLATGHTDMRKDFASLSVQVQEAKMLDQIALRTPAVTVSVVAAVIFWTIAASS